MLRAPDEGQCPLTVFAPGYLCPMTTTVVHLVRHARSRTRQRLVRHLEGFPLSAKGRETAEALGEFFASHTLAAVYSSPLTRAQETADRSPLPGTGRVSSADIVETESYLRDSTQTVASFSIPVNLRYFVNPFRPTGGSPIVRRGTVWFGPWRPCGRPSRVEKSWRCRT